MDLCEDTAQDIIINAELFKSKLVLEFEADSPAFRKKIALKV
jgi:hypothetical protein